MSIETHKTEQGVLSFDGRKCIHSRNCVLIRPDVFVPDVKGEWIHPEKATSAELRALADNCPSGAIHYEETDKPQRKPVVNTLHIRENGPYALHAEMDGEKQAAFKMTLCRCGASKNKPLCDCSHIKAGFIATGEVMAVESQALENQAGPLSISPLENGPIKLQGNLEICAGTGHTVDRLQQVFLCRCGHSKKKPYCDGSHTKAGFKTED
ncbi:FIG00793105: hypothetical protein [hydrothermal vent metagenome]|uniref:Iron-binding zinc finger CDGSH type domain-containing protein n=1 Tax=hydrothermal vent metagenome TaxID=652676 RepID=A0A3B0YG58_9ZZZZ